MGRKTVLIQLALAALLLAVLGLLVNNLTVNLIRTGLGLGFGWLSRPAGFALAETALPYTPSDSYLWALLIGWMNSLKVILGWEATSGISCGHNSGDNGFHLRS